MMKIALVTDSTSDIPSELLEANHIYMVPNTVNINGQSYLDGIEISRDEFYRQLPGLRSQPTTATGSPGTYQTLYNDLLAKGFEKIISIHPSRLLSGIYNAASNAALLFDNKVYVIDSTQLSLGLGFQVLAAAEDIANGNTLETILSNIEAVRRRVRVVAMLDTLEYVRRSGRVSWAKARIGNLLRFKPFVELKDGKVLSIGESRTRRKGIERLLDMINKFGKLEMIAILHSNAESDALKIQDQVKNLTSKNHSLLINVTTVIGVHVGPNALGFAVIIS